MNYEKLVREWCAHYGGSVRTTLDTHVVALPSGMSTEWGDSQVLGRDWEDIYAELTTGVVYPATRVGSVPGGAR